MGLTRKMLSAMDIPAEKIDEIISAHTDTVSAVKEERDNFKADADRLKAVEDDLKKANEELDAFKSGDWESKYNSLKSEYDDFKSATQKKETKAKKTEAYRNLLKEAGISEKRIASVLKVSDVDSVELDKEGKIKDADSRLESVKKEWADFIPTKQERGADVSNPPANTGGDVKKPSRAAELVAQYRNEHYGSPKED